RRTRPGPANQHDVARLQIAVDDADAMGLIERAADLRRDRKRLVELDRSAFQAFRERLALEVLHDEEVLADAVERADVRMRELRNGPRLAREPFAELRIVRELGRQDLDGDEASQPRVARAVHLAHPAGAERLFDLVGTEHRSRSQHDVTLMGSVWRRPS